MVLLSWECSEVALRDFAIDADTSHPTRSIVWLHEALATL